VEDELAAVSLARRQVDDRVLETQGQIGMLDGQLESGIAHLRDQVRDGITVGLRQAVDRALQSPALGQPWTGNNGERFLLLPTDLSIDGFRVSHG
jgi:hypothetical protein